MVVSLIGTKIFACALQSWRILNSSLLFFFPQVKDADTCRIDELDGIRGWAAFRVLIGHTRGGLELNPSAPLILEIFANGPLCVRIFFILSGDALSYSVTKPGSKGISPGVVLKRIPRLRGTITIGVMFLFVLFSVGYKCYRVDPQNQGWGGKWTCYDRAIDNYGLMDYLYFAWAGI